MGFGYLTLSVYLPILTKDMGASVTLVSVMFATGSVAAATAHFLSGPLSARIGIKVVVVTGGVALLSGYLLLYLASGLGLVYLATTLMGFGLAWAGMLPAGRVTANWFIRRQGLMVGIAFACGGLGGVVGGPLVSILTANYGWRFACLMSVLLVAVLVVPALVFLKGAPEDIGQRALGADTETDPTPAVGSTHVRLSAPLVLMLLVVLATGYVLAGHDPHLANVLVTHGLGLEVAGLVVGVAAIFHAVGNIVVGLVNDRFGARAAVVHIAACTVVAFALLPLASTVPSAAVFAVFYGMFQSIGITFLTVLTLRVMGPESFPTMFGLVNGVQAGLAIGTPVLVGYLYDATGSYTTGSLIAVGAAFVVLGGGLAAIRAGDRARGAVPSVAGVLSPEPVAHPLV